MRALKGTRPLDKAAGLRAVRLGAAVFDLTQRQVEFIRMLRRATKLGAIVGQNGHDLQPVLWVEGQNIVVHHSRGGRGLLIGVQQSKGGAGIAIDHGLQPQPLNRPAPYTRRILTEQWACCVTRHMAGAFAPGL